MERIGYDWDELVPLRQLEIMTRGRLRADPALKRKIPKEWVDQAMSA
jgi:hypothetical protein